MPKAAVKKKRFILGGLLALIAIIGIAGFLLFDPNVGHTYYEPSYLPPGVSIKEKRISINQITTSVEQNFRTVDWVYSIQEGKVDASIGTAQQDYDPASINPTCSILSSPAKQRYRLCHWIDYGRIDVHQVIFIKGGTYIRADIPTSLQQQISIQEIGRFVDSFKPRSTLGLPVLRSNV